MEVVLSLGIILVVGYFFGLVAEKLQLPRVTSYLFAGILFSPSFLGDIVPIHLNSWSEILVNICLGLIAFVIGGKIKVSELRENGKVVFWGTFFESLCPMILVFSAFYILSSLIPNISPKLAILMAAVASTTAPAATVAIIEQYKAKGLFTNTLLDIVALDDAFGVILFTLVTTFYFGESFSSGLTLLGTHLLIAIIIGALAGLLITKFAHLSHTDDYLFPLLMGIILIIVSLGETHHFSSLLACIVMGTVSNNTFKQSEKVSLLLPIEHIEEFVFITFFTIAGTHFSLDYFQIAAPIIAIYLIARATGKYLGAFVGIKLSSPKIDKRTPQWIGLALMPQAGVAIGLVFQLTQRPEVEPIKSILINAILGSTIIYEVLGPVLAKLALRKAGDIPASKS